MNRQRYRPGKSDVGERKMSLKSQHLKEFYRQKRHLSKNPIYCTSGQLNGHSAAKGMYTKYRFRKHAINTYVRVSITGDICFYIVVRHLFFPLTRLLKVVMNWFSTKLAGVHMF